MLTNILFDLDGTLVDTGEGIYEGVIYAIEKMGLVTPKDEVLKEFIGPPLKDSMMRYCGLPPSRADEAVARFREYYRMKGIYQCKLYPHILDMLDILRENDFIIMIATSKPTEFAKTMMSHLGCADFFCDIEGSSLDGKRSRKADIIRFLLEKHHITMPHTVAMVGDKIHDLDGAAACGVHGIGVTYGYGSREELLAGEYDMLLDSPGEVAEYILKHR